LKKHLAIEFVDLFDKIAKGSGIEGFMWNFSSEQVPYHVVGIYKFIEPARDTIFNFCVVDFLDNLQTCRLGLEFSDESIHFKYEDYPDTKDLVNAILKRICSEFTPSYIDKFFKPKVKKFYR
jgi:hypothetical protein